jgi:hypothetical protein
MARSNTGFVCHAHTSLVSYEIHHIWPQEYHGPNVKANLVKICPNAHSDIHHLLHLMLTGRPYDLRDYGPNIRTLAQSGYDAIHAYAQSLAQEKS